MKSFSLLFGVVSLIFISWPTAEVFGSEFLSPRAVASRALFVLQNEITRDEGILDSPMNIIRLRESRLTIASGFAAKDEVLRGFDKFPIDALAGVVTLLKRTLADEHMIAENIRIGEVTRIRTARTIKANLQLKINAVEDVKSWLDQ